jgi:AcrR family transcriptional regulator
MPTKKKKPANEPISKDELFWKILDAALKLELTHGHVRWKMTDLARASGVTRTLIYYYFGHSKESILQAAITIIGEEFFGLSEARQALWSNRQIWESFRKSRALVKNTPHIPIFYLEQRQPEKPFYQEMQTLEKRYLQKLSGRFPKASTDSLRAAFATFFGIVTIAEIDDTVLENFLNGIIKLLDGAIETSSA